MLHLAVSQSSRDLTVVSELISRGWELQPQSLSKNGIQKQQRFLVYLSHNFLDRGLLAAVRSAPPDESILIPLVVEAGAFYVVSGLSEDTGCPECYLRRQLARSAQPLEVLMLQEMRSERSPMPTALLALYAPYIASVVIRLIIQIAEAAAEPGWMLKVNHFDHSVSKEMVINIPGCTTCSSDISWPTAARLATELSDLWGSQRPLTEDSEHDIDYAG